jgi:nitrous oxidase accessory protein NosD
MRSLITTAALALAAQTAAADIAVQFTESAPKDRFVIQNIGTCATGEATITLVLNGSAGGLIFDVTERGAGVEVFQPFDLVSGAEALTGLPVVEDGDSALVLNVAELAPGAQIVFTIDVDDTASARGIMVSGAEISGATVNVSRSGETRLASFDQNAAALVALPPCPAA